MADKKIRLKEQNEDGTYDYLYPASKSEIVDVKGKTLDTVLAETAEKITENNENFTAQLEQKADKTQLEALSGGTPKLIVQNVSNLPSSVASGDERLALVIADGHKYYWSGSSWVDGGIYQAVEVADGTITPIKLNRGSVDTLSDNLYKPADVIYGEYVGTSGEIIVAPTWTDRGRTPYYNVEAGATYILTIMSAYKDQSLFFYKFNNEDMVNKTKVALIPTEKIDEYIFTVPEDRNFTRWTIGTGFVEKTYFRKVVKGDKFDLQWLSVNGENIEESVIDEAKLVPELREKLNRTEETYTQFLQGKGAMYVGDSITAGIGASDRYLFSYPVQLNKLLKLLPSAYLNYGVSGTAVAVIDGTNTSFVERVESMPSLKKDVAFIKGGTNDFTLNVPIETLAIAKAYKLANGVWNRKEFFGAYCDMIEMMKAKNVAKRIILLTPIPKENQEITNTYGKLVKYVDAVISIANEYNLTVLDLFRTLEINVANPADVAFYLPDGTHPNDAGYKLIAERIARFITYEYSIQLSEIITKQLSN